VPLETLWALAALALAAALVFQGTLGYFFAQDDFAGLARARGLLPALTGPWRYLSGQTYFDLMKLVAGLDPLPYHVVSVSAHAICALVLFALLARYATKPAAWVATLFFVVHRAHYTAIYSISGIGEILAAAFGLGALCCVSISGSIRWAAVPLFALSLLCKESTVLLPLVAMLIPTARLHGSPATAEPARARARDPVILTMTAIAALYVVSFVARDAFGIRQVLPEREPYALGFDATLIRNLLTYLGWTANFLLPTVRTSADMVDPAVYGYGIVAALVWLVGFEQKELRARGWVAAGALYLAMLLPVLPLRNHTYHYYLYGPLAGAAWGLALLWDSGPAVLLVWIRRRPETAGRDARAKRDKEGRKPAGWGLALLIGIGLTVNGALLVRKVETDRVVFRTSRTGASLYLRRDPTVDRALIAANATADLGRAGLPDGIRLRFMLPGVLESQRMAGRDTTQETYLESNVRAALLDGLGVRVLFPGVHEAEFVRARRPAGPSEAYALYRHDGHLQVMQGSQLDSLVRGSN
jgi:hypothetical protein